LKTQLKLKTRILLNTFASSFAGMLLQRGLYFFTHDVLGFSRAQNLWFALMFGVAYLCGARASHRLTAHFGERRTLLALITLSVLVQAALVWIPGVLALTIGFSAMAALLGARWPIFESYMCAGETPQSLGRALSRYNISWALSVAPALWLAGPLIASGTPRALFAVAAVLHALVGASCLAFPPVPARLDAAHPARPDPLLVEHSNKLLASARFVMLESYTLLFLLAPLMPEIMHGVGFETAAAARASSVLDVARLGCFVGLFAYTGWHGRRGPIAFAIVALPLGFALVLFGRGVTSVISGELLFGVAMGFLYTAALFYAQLVKNASVDAGGAHEALIGLGYALGPGAGLIGVALSQGAGPSSARYVHAMSGAVLPLILVCSCGALWTLFKARSSTKADAARKVPIDRSPRAGPAEDG
jgi:MFS family permease